jgi:hypothetical protein
MSFRPPLPRPVQHPTGQPKGYSLTSARKALPKKPPRPVAPARPASPKCK